MQEGIVKGLDTDAQAVDAGIMKRFDFFFCQIVWIRLQ
jgi:hypothetical protein